MPAANHPNRSGTRPNLPWRILLKKRELREKYDEWVCDFAMMTISQLREIIEQEHSPALKRAVAQTLIHIANDGNMEALEKLLDRAIGKPVDCSQVMLRDTAELAQHMLSLPMEERIALIEARLKEIKDGK